MIEIIQIIIYTILLYLAIRQVTQMVDARISRIEKAITFPNCSHTDWFIEQVEFESQPTWLLYCRTCKHGNRVNIQLEQTK